MSRSLPHPCSAGSILWLMLSTMHVQMYLCQPAPDQLQMQFLALGMWQTIGVSVYHVYHKMLNNWKQEFVKRKYLTMIIQRITLYQTIKHTFSWLFPGVSYFLISPSFVISLMCPWRSFSRTLLSNDQVSNIRPDLFNCLALNARPAQRFVKSSAM